MEEETIVQFVVFETALDTEEFSTRWEQYEQPGHNGTMATLQQRILKNGKFKYISKHTSPSKEFQFFFERERRHSKAPEAEIKKQLAGGYVARQIERTNESMPGESKIIVFASDAGTDLESFTQFPQRGKLNIYEAYYQNCEYAYILEFFVKDEYATDMLQELKTLTLHAEAGIYKECQV